MLVVLVLAQSAVAFIVCSLWVEISSEVRLLVVHIFVIALGFGWASFAISQNGDQFVNTWACLAIACCPPVLMVLTEHPYAFWASLASVSTCSVLELLSSLNKEKRQIAPWQKVLDSIYVLWIVTGVILVAGETPYFQYAKPALDLPQVHSLLDIRYLISALLIFLFLAKAVWNAFRDKPPQIQDVDIPLIQNVRIVTTTGTLYSVLLSFLQPFVIVINALLVITEFFLNLAWKLLAMFLTYLYRTGVNIGEQLKAVLSDKHVWLSITRVTVTFFLVTTFVYGVSMVVPHISLYLTSDTSLDSTLDELAIGAALKWMGGFFALTLLAIVTSSWLWGFDDFLNKAVFGGPMIVLASGLAGGLLYALARITFLKIAGFSSFGVFSLLISVIVLFVLLVHMGQSAAEYLSRRTGKR